MDGTASLANRDFGRVLRANQRQLVFSGAAKSANDTAIARCFSVLKAVSPEIGTRWRSETDSNYRYRFLNWQTTAFRRRLQHSDESRSVESDVFENRETGRTGLKRPAA
jgi:hypothetical protein